MWSVERRVGSVAVFVVCLCLMFLGMGDAQGAEPTVESPDGLQCSLSRLDGGYKIANSDARYGRLKLSGLGIDRPIIFELGPEGRHLRRIYPSSSKRAIAFDATPMAEYAIYPTDGLADHVLKDVCAVNPKGLSRAHKLEALASLASRDATDRHSKRLAIEALQALLGIEFRAKMEYASTEGGDYRAYAGGDFRVTSSVTNTGSERLSDVKFGLMPPDEWSVKLGSNNALPALSPGASTSCVSTVRAPGRSSLRAPVSPVIAMLTIKHLGREFTIHYPFEVKLADPFVPKLTLLKAHPDRLEAKIDLTTCYPGRDMKSISVYPWLDTDLTIRPDQESVNMAGGKGSFRLDYLPMPRTESYRAVTVIMQLDEHLVRLRSVMEASLALGATAAGAALWLNSCPDGLVTPTTIGERKCRATVANPAGPTRYMYFAASPNVPAQGATYITVTYYDDAEGSFMLQYDSTDRSAPMDGTYKSSGETVQLEGTRTWKTKTFSLDDAGFDNRQDGKSDFRLAVSDGDLAVTRVVVSKFLPEQMN